MLLRAVTAARRLPVMPPRRSRRSASRAGSDGAWSAMSSSDLEPELAAADRELDIRRSPAARAAARARECNTTLVANLAVGAVAFIAALAFLTAVLQIGVVGVGIVNPAWQTYKALEVRERNSDGSSADEDSDDDEYSPPGMHAANWAAYWVVAAMLYLSSMACALPAGLVTLPAPLVPALLLPMLLYLTRDNAAQSRRIYTEFARPAFRAVESSVDGSVVAAVQHVEYLSGVALVQLYAAVEPYAKQLKQAAAASARQIAPGAGSAPKRVKSER